MVAGLPIINASSYYNRPTRANFGYGLLWIGRAANCLWSPASCNVSALPATVRCRRYHRGQRLDPLHMRSMASTAIRAASWSPYLESKSEPDLQTRPASLHNLTYGRRSGGCTTIPLAPNLIPGCWSHEDPRSVRLDPSGL